MEIEHKTILLDAMDAGADFNQVKLLIDEGADVNAASKHGRSPLLEAVAAGYTETVRLLLQHGADVNQCWILGEETEPQTGAFGKGMSFLIGHNMSPDDDHYKISPASEARTKDIAIALYDSGANINDFIEGAMLEVAGADKIEVPQLTANIIHDNYNPERGTQNPEVSSNPFWINQIKTGKWPFSTFKGFFGRSNIPPNLSPAWTFSRYGRTITPLTDGRIVLIAGEHEDSYVPDFYIYSDVVLLDRKGGVKLYNYPVDVFPPTDFHTATLFDDHILLIGNLGYSDARRVAKTQVLRLNLDDFSIEPIETSGNNPGWISRHSAVLEGTTITISGGKVQTKDEYLDRNTDYVLDTETMVWTKVE